MSRRSWWWVFWRICAAVCGLSLVLVGVEWAFETAPYLVAGVAVLAVAGLVAQ